MCTSNNSNPTEIKARIAEMIARLPSDTNEKFEAVHAFFAVLDLAAESPGGWNALIDGVRASGRAAEVVSFCRAFTMVCAAANNTIEDAHCVHDAQFAV